MKLINSSSSVKVTAKIRPTTIIFNNGEWTSTNNYTLFNDDFIIEYIYKTNWTVDNKGEENG